MSDQVTVLQARGQLRMAKRFDGETWSDYDSAKHFKPSTQSVSNLDELADLLDKLLATPRACVIRGQLKVGTPDDSGLVVRQLQTFEDVPHHWIMLDIDGFEPDADPVRQPEEAITEYITRELPAAFHDVSFYWQLSNRAGFSDSLKAHVWFWLDTPYSSDTLREWASAERLNVDKSLFNPVQVHYTAAPIFDGVEDPVPQRSGRFESWLGLDSVPLVIDPDVLAVAEEKVRNGEFTPPDPTEKSGWVGAFCRAYSIDEVIDDFLPHVFERFDDGGHLNYLMGGGSPRGAFITDDNLHIVNTHNSSPFGRHATNAFDLVRYYLHDGESDDPDAEVHKTASFKAMCRWCAADPKVSEAVADDSLTGLLEAAASATRRDISLAEAKLYLARIPTDVMADPDQWLNVGMALHFQFDGSSDALKAWQACSPADKAYACADEWSLFLPRPGGVTFGTVVHLAGGHPTDLDLALAAVSESTTYEQAVSAVAHYHLMDAHLERVAKAIQSRADDFQLGKVQPRSVKKDIGETRKAQRKEESDRIADDLETALAKETLRRYYGSGKHLLVAGQLFWVYDRGVWRMHDDQMVRSHVYDVLQVIRANAREDKRYAALLASVKDSGRDNATNALSDSVFNIVKKRVAVDLYADPLRFNRASAPAVMNCLNGELWFQPDGTFDVLEHEPDHRFTAQLDVDHDPEATCPNWDAALHDFFGDLPDGQDVIRHLHEVLGYLCQFSRNEAMFLILKGNGANGKTLISRVLQALLGDATHQQDIGSLSDRQDAHMGAALVGKLLMIDDDYKKGAPLPDDMIKKLSEGKRMTANPKHGKTFNFVARATPMILSNSWPSSRDGSFGIDRRARVFRFERQFEDHEKDATLPDRIVDLELSGVLNRLVAGFQRFQRRGYFDVPPSCVDAFREWKRASNIVAQFAGEGLTMVSRDAKPILAHTVLAHFRAWTAYAELGAYKIGKSRFYDELGAIHGITVEGDSKGRYVVYGVELAPLETDEEVEGLFGD